MGKEQLETELEELDDQSYGLTIELRKVEARDNYLIRRIQILVSETTAKLIKPEMDEAKRAELHERVDSLIHTTIRELRETSPSDLSSLRENLFIYFHSIRNEKLASSVANWVIKACIKFQAAFALNDMKKAALSEKFEVIMKSRHQIREQLNEFEDGLSDSDFFEEASPSSVSALTPQLDSPSHIATSNAVEINPSDTMFTVSVFANANTKDAIRHDYEQCFEKNSQYDRFHRLPTFQQDGSIKLKFCSYLEAVGFLNRFAIYHPSSYFSVTDIERELTFDATEDGALNIYNEEKRSPCVLAADEEAERELFWVEMEENEVIRKLYDRSFSLNLGFDSSKAIQSEGKMSLAFNTKLEATGFFDFYQVSELSGESYLVRDAQGNEFIRHIVSSPLAKQSTTPLPREVTSSFVYNSPEPPPSLTPHPPVPQGDVYRFHRAHKPKPIEPNNSPQKKTHGH